MAENFDESGHGKPHDSHPHPHGSEPSGDIPLDFLDSAEPSHAEGMEPAGGELDIPLDFLNDESAANAPAFTDFGEPGPAGGDDIPLDFFDEPAHPSPSTPAPAHHIPQHGDEFDIAIDFGDTTAAEPSHLHAADSSPAFDAPAPSVSADEPDLAALWSDPGPTHAPVESGDWSGTLAASLSEQTGLAASAEAFDDFSHSMPRHDHETTPEHQPHPHAHEPEHAHTHEQPEPGERAPTAFAWPAEAVSTPHAHEESMLDELNEHHETEPQHQHPAAELSDFDDLEFGGEGEIEPAHVHIGEPGQVSGLAPIASPFERHIATAPSSPSAVEPAHHKPVFPVVIGFLSVIALVVAWMWHPEAGGSGGGPAAAAPVAAGAAPSPAPSGEPPATAASVAALAKQLDELKAHADELAKQDKAIQARIDAQPKPSPDLGPVQAKLDDVAKAASGMASLSKAVAASEKTTSSLRDDVSSLRDDLKTQSDAASALKTDVGKQIAALKTDLGKQIAALQGDLKKLSAGAPTATSSTNNGGEPKPATSVPTTPKPAAPAMSQGADLFKAGKFADADAFFAKLTAANSTDARAWYYAALAHGSATSDWNGAETQRLINKAVVLEKADKSKKAEIDDAFTSIPTSLNDWFKYYRAEAAK